MSPIRTLVLLKYEILISDNRTWRLCEKYPLEVRKNWAWRCVADVEHLAAGNKEAEHCISVAKKYRDGLATMEELNTAHYAAHAAQTTTAYDAAAYAAYRAAAVAYSAVANNAAYAAHYAAHYAAYAVHDTNSTAKWNQYTEWLIEELCIWEEKQ